VPDFNDEFLVMRSLEELLKILAISSELLRQLLAAPEYTIYHIPKKSGGTRTIQAPQGLLRQTQVLLAKYLQTVYSRHHLPCVHGFVPSAGLLKYGVLSNAVPHLDKPFVLNMDIKKFFESISAKKVKKSLCEFPYYFNEEVATAIALLCTYQKQLPTGAPTSPVLSNMVFYIPDVALLQWITDVNEIKQIDETAIGYTRYADDLTFSGPSNLVLSLQDRIISFLATEGFEINAKKTRAQTPHGPQWVTGIKVNERLNISRYYIRNLRAVIHQMRVHAAEVVVRRYLKLPATTQINTAHVKKMLSSVQSKIAWVGMVRGKADPVYLRLQNQFNVAREVMPVNES
jgi:RNA-directed DNA polymerase